MKRKSKRRHNPVHSSGDDGLAKAAKLAPLEERKGKLTHQTVNDKGLLSFDTGSLKLPKDLSGQEEHKSWLFGLEPVTIVILTFALAFIAFIAYLISIEPPKAKDEPPPAAESPR